MVLVPFFVASLLLSQNNDSLKWVALALFVIASLTDFADGYIARKYNLITNFGKFMDPLADKILTVSGMICLIELGRIPSWIVVIIVAREFIISGFRLVAAENGVVIAANYWGKLKTNFQMAMIILMIMNILQLQLLTNIVMWIALALTLISLWTYIMANKQVLAGEK
jgi:CDP-diacylglycerol--glycerol-3-phosphate 3-phosphatidyltransferase